MKRESEKNYRAPVINVRLLSYLRNRSDKTIEAIAAETGHSVPRVHRVCDGTDINIFRAYDVWIACNGDWSYATRLDLDESDFPRAFRPSGSKADSKGAEKGRSSRGGSAGRSKIAA